MNTIVAEVGVFPERAYGSDALALQGRFPGEVYPNLKPLLGLSSSESEHAALQAYKERYPAVQTTLVKELGTTMFKSTAFAEGEMPWGVEELLAMELANIRRNAETMAGKGNVVEDVVITIPTFYTADERRAIERAAKLAGLDVKALISDGLAVGMDYAKSRTFPEVTKGERPEHHIVFDMGAGSTAATLLRFQGRSVKDVGRFNKTVQEVAILGTGWDKTLGGDSLNDLILNDYILKFLTKPAMKSRNTQSEDIRSNGRVMSRLWKEAEKARQVLSANTETSSSFEELLPDIDFRVRLTRTDFEKLASEYADRVGQPINDALAAAKMSMRDVDSIILHGGAVRTPFVQKKLEEIAGGSAKLRSNVNADESAVFGAAFKGAGLSPSFKVKEIRDSDVAGYAAGMTYVDGEKKRRQSLFSAMSAIGHGAATKQVTFKAKEDFGFGLYQQVGEVDRPITKIQTENLTASVKALKEKWGCEKEEISTKFSIKLSPVDGLPGVLGGSVSCEVEDSGKAESIGDSVKDWLGFGKKKDQEPLQEGEEDEGPIEDVEATTSSSSAPEPSGTATSSSSTETSTSSKAPEKPKKRTESISIALTTSPQGNPQPAPEEMKRMRDRLTAFDRSDRARLAREEALNVLESYTYYIRDFLANADFETVSTKAQRGEISKMLTSTREFMESPKDVSKATEEVLKGKLKDLKKLVEPIQVRRKEEVARPEKVQALKDSLEQTQKLVDMVREQVQKASEAQSKASAYEAEQASSTSETSESVTAMDAESSTTTPAASSDDLADLEEPDTSSSEADSTTIEPPTYSNPADFSPYSNMDLTSLSEAYDSVFAWLSEKEAEQAKLKPHDEPVLLVKDIEKKANELSEIMRDLIYKQMKTPPKSSKKSKASSSSKTKSAKKTKSKSTSSKTEDEEPTASGEKPPVLTVNAGDDMPSEDEILSMVSSARAKSKTKDEL